MPAAARTQRQLREKVLFCSSGLGRYHRQAPIFRRHLNDLSSEEERTGPFRGCGWRIPNLAGILIFISWYDPGMRDLTKRSPVIHLHRSAIFVVIWSIGSRPRSQRLVSSAAA